MPEMPDKAAVFFVQILFDFGLFHGVCLVDIQGDEPVAVAGEDMLVGFRLQKLKLKGHPLPPYLVGKPQTEFQQVIENPVFGDFYAFPFLRSAGFGEIGDGLIGGAGNTKGLRRRSRQKPVTHAMSLIAAVSVRILHGNHTHMLRVKPEWAATGKTLRILKKHLVSTGSTQKDSHACMVWLWKYTDLVGFELIEGGEVGVLSLFTTIVIIEVVKKFHLRIVRLLPLSVLFTLRCFN